MTRKAATRKQRRMLIVVAGMALAGIAVALMLAAFEDNIVFFYGPTEVREGKLDTATRFRLGGLVAEGSVRRIEGEATTLFAVTDMREQVEVAYTGLLPDLFREGQGIVAHGRMNENGVFVADEVLAKHDENYMPPEVVEAMKRAGTWQHAGQPEKAEQQ